MHGRFYDRRQVVASIYDGITKYNQYTSNRESIEEQEKRLANYAKWLEGEGNENESNGDETAESQDESANEMEPETEEHSERPPAAPRKKVSEDERREEDYFEGDDE